jgi:hypothetical protein
MMLYEHSWGFLLCFRAKVLLMGGGRKGGAR